MATRSMKVLTTALSLSMILSPLAPAAQAFADEALQDESIVEVTSSELVAPEGDATEQQDALDVDGLAITTEDITIPELDSVKEEAIAEESDGERAADEQQRADQDNVAAISDGSKASASVTDGTKQGQKDAAATPDFSMLEIKPLVKLTEGFDIKVNITGLPEGTKPADYTVTYWFGDDEASAITEPLTSKSNNLFRVACCPATKLTVPAHVRVYYKSEAEPVQSLDYSVRDYCDSVRNDGKLSFLAVNALRYGSAAQRFFNVNTGSLASTGYNIGVPGSIFSTEKFLPDKYAAKKSGSTELVNKTTVALDLGSKVAINFYIDPAGDPSMLPVAVDGMTIKDGAEVVDRDTGATISRRTLADGRIRVRVAGIDATKLDHAYRLEMGVRKLKPDCKFSDLCHVGSAIIDPFTIEFSALSYAQANQHGTDDMYNLCIMLYRYYRAANLFTYYYYD